MAGLDRAGDGGRICTLQAVAATSSLNDSYRRCVISTDIDQPATVQARKHGWQLHRRLYDWVLHWADTRYGTPALFALSFAESSFFPVPPDVLLIALALGNRRKSLWFALWCSIASVLGGLLGYLIGYGALAWLAQRIVELYGYEDKLVMVETKFNEWGFWYVFLAGFTPIPYKVFTIAAGMFKMNVLLFALASSISRSARFFLVAVLIRQFGPAVKPLIDKYFNLLCLTFGVLLVGGVLVVKYIR